MPTLLHSHILARAAASQERTTPRHHSHNPTSTRVWIIVVSVVSVLALSACIALLAMYLSKRRLRKPSIEEARQRDPCLGEKKRTKTRRSSRDILDTEAESQRAAMIRKAVASRSGTSLTQGSHFTLSVVSVEERPDSRSSSQGRRVQNEEPCERKLSRTRCRPGLDSDKSREGGFSALSASPLLDKPARTFSRSSSPSGSQHVAPGHPELPPLLELHPLFRNTSGESGSGNRHR